MNERPSLGEFVVFSSGLDAAVYCVRGYGQSNPRHVKLQNMSSMFPKPFLWSHYNKLRYLSQAQAKYFFREE